MAASMGEECPLKVAKLEKYKKNYNFATDQIERIDFLDPRVDEFIAHEVPVIITNSDVVKPALKWNVDFLEKHIGDALFLVYSSNTNRFKYFDEKKKAFLPGFTEPALREEITFQEFVKRCRSDDGKRYYLQQPLHNTVGENIVKDFVGFNWKWLNSQRIKNKWGQLTSNLLLCGMPGNLTPCHYDEQHNLFGQLSGYKRVVMFHPKYYENLYPYPCFHPHDRQSMVDVESPDAEMFPKFSQVKGVKGVVGPGDVLYIPMYWWHHVESVPDGGITSSITFWHKGSSPSLDAKPPFTAQQKVAIRRNIEKMLSEALVDPREVMTMFREIVEGRYTAEAAWLEHLEAPGSHVTSPAVNGTTLDYSSMEDGR